MSAAGSNPAPSALTRYHGSRAALTTAVGVLALVCGGCVLAAVVVAEVQGTGTAWAVALGGIRVVTTVAGGLLVLAAVRLLRAGPVLVLDSEGYRVSRLYGAGVRTAAWREVEDVVMAGTTAHPIVQIRLRDGRGTSLMTRFLDEPTAVWLRDIDTRLSRAHGQRRLR